MQDKGVLVKSHAFSKLPTFQDNEYQPGQKSAYLSTSQEILTRALLCQSIKKTHKSNIYNFRALCQI